MKLLLTPLLLLLALFTPALFTAELSLSAHQASVGSELTSTVRITNTSGRRQSSVSAWLLRYTECDRNGDGVIQTSERIYSSDEMVGPFPMEDGEVKTILRTFTVLDPSPCHKHYVSAVIYRGNRVELLVGDELYVTQ